MTTAGFPEIRVTMRHRHREVFMRDGDNARELDLIVASHSFDNRREVGTAIRKDVFDAACGELRQVSSR